MTIQNTILNRRFAHVSALCVAVALLASFTAKGLVALINAFTHLAYFGEFSLTPVSPSQHHLGAWSILVPVVGGLLIGAMARFGAPAIRGHGIPEAMERILFNESHIPARMTVLKPLSAAISIGTGGPFGAEGPIIATGGALGSLLGQLIETTASERRTLLAAGAAAGMTAIFGTPVAAVLIAIELLLFEYRPRSYVPVAIAATVAACLRLWSEGSMPTFPMPMLPAPQASAVFTYAAEGALLGIMAVLVTRLVYGIEDRFEKLPFHWMWWPAMGGLAVGVVGFISPQTLGVGYENISDILAGRMAGTTLLFFCVMKLVSWSIALGSGTSGGTLAPLLTIGGGLGGLLGGALSHAFPQLGIDPRLAALVGMAAMFTGASRALLTSIVFAYEMTHQDNSLLPLLGGCSAAFTVSSILMKTTIMTEKLERRGRKVPSEYVAHPEALA